MLKFKFDRLVLKLLFKDLGGRDIPDNNYTLVLNKQVYYRSTVNLIKALTVISVVLVGGILIFRNDLESKIDEYYIKSATLSLWICVIGCGMSYYILNSNYKKSLKMFGIEEVSEPEPVKRARLFGSTRFEYLSIIISICMLAIGMWFGIFFSLLGLLNM